MITELKNYAWDATKAVSHILDIEYALDGLKDTPNSQIDRETLGKIECLFGKLDGLADDLELTVAKSQLVSVSLEISSSLSPQRAITLLQIARETFATELKSRVFLAASSRLLKYTGRQIHFGQAVASVFPKCSEDIAEAHECFAFGRFTACAFHIGRVMELAVARLAHKMEVPKQRLWQDYIDAMNKKIKAMPRHTEKERQKIALYSGATNYLFNFKEAWRNPTMHPEKTYTENQAEEVLACAGSFLRHACEKIFRRRL